MKITFKETKPIENIPTIGFYRCIKGMSTGTVVLFSDKSTGIVVVENKKCHFLGELSTTWVPYDDNDWWVQIHGKITIEA
jgi:hypothetical protein